MSIVDTKPFMLLLALHSISVLEHCTSLTDLFFPYNNVSDLTPLSNLTALKELYLHDNQISEISPLLNDTMGWDIEGYGWLLLRIIH